MKSRPLPIIVSPTSLILKERSHSYAEKERSQARLRVPEIKSVLIARKLNNEDLYGSSLKIRSPSELSQIKEEKLDKSETLSNVDIAESQVVYQEPKVFKSMFQTDTLGSPKFKEHGIGPQYKNNKIIKHSIVGSSDGFEKYQKSLQKIHLHSMRSQDLDNNSDMVMSRLHKMSSSIILKDENNPNATLLSRRPSVKPKPKDSKKETKISKENIIDKIEEMKRQQESFYKTQAIGYSRLPLDEKLNQTKEERRLQSFNNTMEDWQKMTTDIAKKAGRTPESSVMSRNESFRGKREITDLLEEGKTDSEQLGNHFWHVTLRKYGEDYEKGNHCSVIRDFPQGFNSKQLNNTLSHFQVIRSPSKISGAEYTTKSIDKTKKIDRTYNEYLESKFAKLGKLIKKIKPTDMDQVSTLMVQGKNKLDMEATLVQKEEEDEDGFYVPQAFLQSKNEEKVDQTITEFYERTMTSKKGHSAYI